MFDIRKLRRSAVLALAAMTVATGLSAVPTGSADAGWRGGYYYGGGYRGYYPGYSGYYGYRNNTGAAVAAGVVGLAAGALIGSALAQPRYYAPAPYAYGTAPYVAPAPAPVYVAPGYVAPTQPYDPSLPVQSGPGYSGTYVATGYAPARGTAEWNAYCASKYRSFDPATGTFLGYDGKRHYCQ
ncbi:BA14K family protein [Microbaculum marinum]|uniref:Lectin-like protein BA14k n=1 Tax=Microbaculum marinum TaxID=1764581 RepID=A0AAW9RMM6_9HYPH